MRTTLEVPVEVAISAAGVPTALVWDGRSWLVTDRPTPWVRRGRWWEVPAPQVRKGALTGFELQTWRFQISPADGDGVSLVVDVARVGSGWVLLDVFD